jgi:Cupin domain
MGDGTTNTRDLCSGVAGLEAGGWLGLHRHAAAEVYQVLTGQGVVFLDGAEHVVQAGTAVYIPSNSEHGIRNIGDDLLEFVYVYLSLSRSGWGRFHIATRTIRPHAYHIERTPTYTFTNVAGLRPVSHSPQRLIALSRDRFTVR